MSKFIDNFLPEQFTLHLSSEPSKSHSKMSFQVFFHNCSAELQNEVRSTIENYKAENFKLSVKSSGSTGTPKQILHDKPSIIASARRTNHFFKLNDKSHVLCPLAIHTIGAKMALFRAIEGEYALHFTEASRNFIENIDQKLQFDLVSLAVIQLESLLKTPYNLNRFSQILLGGSSISVETEKKCLEHNFDAYLGFGMTETLSHIALRKLGTENYSCLEGIVVSSSEQGMRININNKTITSTDRIETIDNKTFKWLGRNDFAINSGGVKIIPEIVEKHLSERLGIAAVVLGISDVTFGEKVVLVTESELNTNQKQLITDSISKEFGKFSAPKLFVSQPFEYINGLKLNRKAIIANVKQRYE